MPKFYDDSFPNPFPTSDKQPTAENTNPANKMSQNNPISNAADQAGANKETHPTVCVPPPPLILYPLSSSLPHPLCPSTLSIPSPHPLSPLPSPFPPPLSPSTLLTHPEPLHPILRRRNRQAIQSRRCHWTNRREGRGSVQQRRGHWRPVRRQQVGHRGPCRARG